MNKKLSEAIESYLNHLHARGLASNTIKSYRLPLNRALAVWGDIYVSSLRPEHIDNVFSHYQWSPKTRNLYLGAFRQFFTYCRKHGFMAKDFDPTDTWRMVKVPEESKSRLAVEDFPRLLQAATDPRDRAVVALGLFTFCRAGEIRTLRIRDVDFDSGEVSIYRHKTQQADRLPLVTELATEMVLWQNTYQSLMGELNPDWFLVPAKDPLPMAWSHLLGRLAPTGAPAKLRPTQRMSHPYRAAQRPLRALGMLEKGVGGHVLRRSGARALFDRLRHEGYDGALKRVQSMLGHSSGTITEQYIGLDIERVQRNELLSNKPMFPDLNLGATVRELRAG